MTENHPKMSEAEEKIRKLWKDPKYRENASSPTCSICGLDYRVCNSSRAKLHCVPAV